MLRRETPGDRWLIALSEVHPRSLPIGRGAVPVEPGIYIWFREGDPIYIGEARGAFGLRGRVRAHFSKGRDLSRSTLRASVAVLLFGVERSVARQRPSVMDPGQIAVVNQWLAACELGWIVCDTPEVAHASERRLRDEWLPPLNRI